jgi:hypothetical protein
MIDDEDYRAFVWIGNNMGPEYATTLVDPWKATAFTALTGKNVLHRIWAKKYYIDDRIYNVLASGCVNTYFLKENNVSLVHNRIPCCNADLVEIRENIYIVKSYLSSPSITGNMLKNPGFEALYGAPPVQWASWSSSCIADFIFPQPGREDGFSIAIRVLNIMPEKTWSAAQWSQNVPVDAGKSYTIGGWVRTEGIDGKGGVMIQPHWIDAGGKTISVTYFMEYLRGTNGWSYFSGQVMAPVSAVQCAVLGRIDSCTGAAWFDDITFTNE